MTTLETIMANEQQKLTVAMVQPSISDNPDLGTTAEESLELNNAQTHENITNLLEPYSKGAFDLLVLPEGVPGLGTKEIENMPWLLNLAKEFECYIIAGEYVAQDGNWYNSATLINPQGEIEDRYFKNVLYGGEQGWLTSGQGPKLFDVNGVKVAPLICIDLADDSLVKNYAEQGADLFVNPTMAVPEKVDQWKADGRAVVEKYGIPYIGVNCPEFTDPEGTKWGGGNSAYFAKDTEARLGPDEEIKIITLD